MWRETVFQELTVLIPRWAFGRARARLLAPLWRCDRADVAVGTLGGGKVSALVGLKNQGVSAFLGWEAR